VGPVRHPLHRDLLGRVGQAKTVGSCHQDLVSLGQAGVVEDRVLGLVLVLVLALVLVMVSAL